MKENIINLNSKNFDEKIKKGIWIVDFWASWCMPCKMMAPQFDLAAKEMKDKVSFGKVNIEEEEELVDRFQIGSVPTLILFKDGEQVDQISGALSKEEIISFIEDS